MDTLQIINLLGVSMVISASVVYIGILIYELWNDKEVDLLQKLADSCF